MPENTGWPGRTVHDTVAEQNQRIVKLEAALEKIAEVEVRDSAVRPKHNEYVCAQIASDALAGASEQAAAIPPGETD